ncbi:hypothetical protein AB5I41_16190 [Sphingomonas sp. MMS24-JH45]
MAFELPPLPYDYRRAGAGHLEGDDDLHHDKHHKAYTDKLNEGVAADPKLEGKSIEDILGMISSASRSSATTAAAIGTTISSGRSWDRRARPSRRAR